MASQQQTPVIPLPPRTQPVRTLTPTPPARTSARLVVPGRNLQDVFADKITVSGRLVSFLNCVVLALYIGAMLTNEWGETNISGKGAPINDTLQRSAVAFDLTSTPVDIGLNEYCITAEIDNWNLEAHKICFKYNDVIVQCQSKNNCTETTGCKEFADVCDRTDEILGCGWAAIVCVLIAAAVSEKIYMVFFGQSLGVILGAATFGLFNSWRLHANDELSPAEVELNTSAWLMMTGAVLAFFSTIICVSDMLSPPIVQLEEAHGAQQQGSNGQNLYADVHSPNQDHPSTTKKLRLKKEVDIFHDGIRLSGRWGSLLCTVSWLLYLIAMADSHWSKTDHLGRAGGFCLPEDQRPVCNSREAVFGLWRYCLQVNLTQFGGHLRSQHLVQTCVNWDDDIAITGDPRGPMDGYQRFDDYDVQDPILTTTVMMMFAVVLLVIADVFSEKLKLCIILNGLGTIFGFAATIAWVTVEARLSEDPDTSRITLEPRGALIIAPWILTLIATILYTHNLHTWLVEYKEEKDGIWSLLCCDPLWPVMEPIQTPQPTRPGYAIPNQTYNVDHSTSV